MPTGIDELDRVLGGGLVPGAAITRCAMGAAFMIFTALHVHQGQGMLELHFGVFVLHAVLMVLWVVVPFELRTSGLDAQGQVVALDFDARAADVDLIVTDVVMPGLSGPALTELLRRRRPDMKALFVSGYADELDLKSVGQARTAHLQKPVTRGNLLAEVSALIHGPAQH